MKGENIFGIGLFCILCLLGSGSDVFAWSWSGRDDCGTYSYECDGSGTGGTHFFYGERSYGACGWPKWNYHNNCNYETECSDMLYYSCIPGCDKQKACCSSSCLTSAACGVSLDNGCKTGCGTGTYCAKGICTSGTCIIPYVEVMRVQCPGTKGEVRIAGIKDGTASKLKIQKGGSTYAVDLVDASANDDEKSCVHVNIDGTVKILRKCKGAATATDCG